MKPIIRFSAILAIVVAPATAAAQSPGSGGSLLGEAPGSGGRALGAGPGEQREILGGRTGPSVPRVPQGITRPGQPFDAQQGGGLQLPPALPEAGLPIYGRLDVPVTAEDEGPPDGLTLDQAIDLLLQANLELQAKALEIPKAEADVLTAGLWANPLLYFDTQFVPYGSLANEAGPTQYDLNITHPIDLNGKWRRRTEVAVRAKDVVGAQFQDAVRLQVDNLYTAWLDALAARETIRYLRASLDGLAELLRATEALRDQGAAVQADVSRVEILRDSTEVALLEAEETSIDARRTLGVLLNLPPAESDFLELRGALQPPDAPLPPSDELIQMALTTRPDLAAFRLGVERARAEVRLAEANRFQDVFLLYQPYTYQDPINPLGSNGSHTSWAIGLTIPLPIYDRNQGNIRRARHTVDQTKLQLADLERQVVAQVRRAERAYVVTAESVRRLEEEILPGARTSLETSEQLYRSGERDLISYLEALRSYNEIARQYRDSLVRHRRATLRLNTVVGLRIFP
ncbi:TolC family protein [Tautonia sociabilis]|uniref:TolC family protein n=1 Tax=Tautonia sociabilis TaxID=2080755 RepID=UPI0013150D43|nr:TolC family protein [Tautonia sociabilis]